MKRCQICQKTLEEKVEEIFKNKLISLSSIHLSLNENLGGVTLCDDCQQILRDVVPAILEELNILEYVDEVGYQLKIK